MTHQGNGHDDDNDSALPPTDSANPSARSNSSDDDQPAIYVVCLAAYNAGVAHGAWLPVGEVEEEDPEEAARVLQARIASEVLATSTIAGAKEWAIHDAVDFAGFEIGECESLRSVVEKAILVADHGALAVAVATYLGADGDPSLLGEVRTWLEDQYLGTYDSATAWAEEWLEETGALDVLDTMPPVLRYHVDVDFASYARDAQLSGDIVVLTPEAGGPCYVFHAW